MGYPPRTQFDHQRGAFAVRFAALPGEAAPGALLARLTSDGREPGVDDRPVDLALETFFAFVPESYRAEAPHGLLVWVSPTDFGGLRRGELRQLLAERRLIWIGAHGSGNERAALDRHALALAVAENGPRHWAIDPARVYVGGYSGGGRVASQLALLWPDRFRGALLIMGCNWYETLQVPGQPGRVWTPSFPRPARRDGFRHLLYLEAPGIDHYGAAPVELWRRALEFLDRADR